jgi:hypothetical protein
VTEKAFHWNKKWTKNGKKWDEIWEIKDWNKNFISHVAKLCGVENGTPKSSKNGEYIYVSFSNTTRLMPSGKKNYTSMDYVFDAKIRADEAILKNEIAYTDYMDLINAGEKPKKEVKNHYKTTARKRLKVIEMSKYGGQKANTGAKKRGIIDILDIPSPSEELIGEHWFCFQCVPNFDNLSVQNTYLQGSSENPVFGEESIKPALLEDAFPTIEYKIGEMRSILKDHKTLDKLTGLVLEKGQYLDEYLSFMHIYQDQNMSERVSSIMLKLSELIEVPDNIKRGSYEVMMAYLKEWGEK